MATRGLLAFGRNSLVAGRRWMASSPPSLLVEQDPSTGVAVLNLNRPPVNSLGMDLMQEVIQTMDRLERDRCPGVVVTSKNKSVFCAGLDLSELYQPEEKRLREFWCLLQDMFLRLYSSPLPMAHLINGHSPAGGTLLAVTGDYRVMVNQPQFIIGLNEVVLGLVPPFWLVDGFVSCVGQRNAELFIQRGQLFSAETAKQLQLVDHLVSTVEEGMAVCQQVLAQFTKVDPGARAHTKLMLRKANIDKIRQNRALDVEVSVANAMDPKTQATLKNYMAQLKKRKSQ